jgi:hypothetical protein
MALIRIGALALGFGLALWRLRRGWETWGHLLQMLVALAAVGAALAESGIAGSVTVGLGVGILGTLYYWVARPAKPLPEQNSIPEEMATPEQERLNRHLDRLLGIGMAIILAGELLLSILYVFEVLPLGWLAALALVLLSPLAAVHLIVRRLRATGPPYDRLPTLSSLFSKPSRF